MHTITPETLEEAVLEISRIESDEALEALIDKIGEEQPLIFTYLMEMGENDFNEDEREILLYLGMAIWQVMARAKPDLSPVNESTVEAVRTHNIQMLEYLTKESEDGFVLVAQTLLNEYNQPAILQYVIDAVIEEKESEAIQEENQGIMIIFLKIVIDCFDQSS